MLDHPANCILIPTTVSQARLNELRKQSIPVQEANNEDSESEYTDETITESEGDEEEEDLSNDPEAQERRVQRELKLLATKLKAFKDKEASARRERTALREQLKLQQKALREERAKYKVGTRRTRACSSWRHGGG